VKNEFISNLLEHYQIGAYINYNEGVFIGTTFILFIIVYSILYNNLCQFIKKSFLGNSVAVVFILSAFLYFLNIVSPQLKSEYPIFLNIFELMEVIEIIIFGILIAIFLYLMIVYVGFILIIRFLIFYLIATLIVGLLIGLSSINISIEPNMLGVIVFVYTLYVSKDIQSGVDTILSNIKNNISCWFDKNEA